MKNNQHNLLLPKEQQLFGDKGNWIVFFIYLSIFINSFVFFKQPFEFYVGYLIFVALLPSFVIKHGFNGTLFIIFVILLIAGIGNILLGNNTAALFFKVYTGLALSYFFYYYVIVEFNYDIERLFGWYLRGCYIAAIVGLIQFISYRIGFEPGYNFRWFLNKWGLAPGSVFGLRINSFFSEPAHLGTVMSAAFFVSIYNFLRKETYYYTRLQSALVIFIYVASFSSLGQTGIFLSIILLGINFGVLRYAVILIPAVIMFFNILYNNVLEFRARLDGMVNLFSGGQFKLGKTHGSSFILYNNYVVATTSFKSNFVFGTGIGSHPVAFEKYSLAKHIKVYGLNFNGADANSMLLRLISETGLFGVIIFLYVMFRGYVLRNPHNETYHWLVSNGILVMILLNLFRQGHYFLNGFPFFVLLYYFNWVSYKQVQQPNQPLYAS